MNTGIEAASRRLRLEGRKIDTINRPKIDFFFEKDCHLTYKFGPPEKIEKWSGSPFAVAATQAYVLGVGATVHTHLPPFYACNSVIQAFFVK